MGQQTMVYWVDHPTIIHVYIIVCPKKTSHSTKNDDWTWLKQVMCMCIMWIIPLRKRAKCFFVWLDIWAENNYPIPSFFCGCLTMNQNHNDPILMPSMPYDIPIYPVVNGSGAGWLFGASERAGGIRFCSEKIRGANLRSYISRVSQSYRYSISIYIPCVFVETGVSGIPW